MTYNSCPIEGSNFSIKETAEILALQIREKRCKNVVKKSRKIAAFLIYSLTNRSVLFVADDIIFA
jgi:hypothetical protein